MAKQALLVKGTDMAILHLSSFPLSFALVSRPCLTNTRSPFTSTSAAGPWNTTVQSQGEVESKVGLFHSRLVALDSATVLTHQRKSLRAAKCSGLATSIVCHFEHSCNRSRLFRVVFSLWWAWKFLSFQDDLILPRDNSCLSCICCSCQARRATCLVAAHGAALAACAALLRRPSTSLGCP